MHISAVYSAKDLNPLVIFFSKVVVPYCLKFVRLFPNLKKNQKSVGKWRRLRVVVSLKLQSVDPSTVQTYPVRITHCPPTISRFHYPVPASMAAAVRTWCDIVGSIALMSGLWRNGSSVLEAEINGSGKPMSRSIAVSFV